LSCPDRLETMLSTPRQTSPVVQQEEHSTE
jgi:hypothetical protein